MARKAKALRYIVDGSDKSYAEPQAAISLTITLANRAAMAKTEKTVYARDSIGNETIGYSESFKDGTVSTTRLPVSRSKIR